jgi:hypothetical protein
MAGRKKGRAPVRQRVRTKPTVQERPARPLKVSVVTTPSGDAEQLTIKDDVDLVKAAVLYADEVELISFGAAMIGSMASFTASGADGILTLFRSLDERTLKGLTGGKGFDAQLLDYLPAFMAFAASPEGRALGLGDDADEFEAAMSQATAELQGVSEQMIRDSGAEELIPCIESGVLTLSDAGLGKGWESDQIMTEWTELLRRRLNDGSTRLLFDGDAGELVALMLRDGMIVGSELGFKHAGEAATGSGLVARLPAFPQAPMDELLDLRRDLKSPLVRYRAAVMRLSKDLPRLVGPELEAHIDDLWRSDVAPAIQEIEETLADHGLVGEIAKHAQEDIKVLIAGGAALFMGMSGAAGLENWVSATIAGAAAATHVAVKTGSSMRDGKQSARRSDLFYLYEANRRLRDS